MNYAPLSLRVALGAAMLLAAPAFAQSKQVCQGSASLGTFRILVRRSIGSVALPIKSLTSIPAGSILLWDPVNLAHKNGEDTEVTAIVAPESGNDLLVLEPRKAGGKAEWDLTVKPAAIAIVVGPQGFSFGKVKSLATRNRQLVDQLADYAEQTSKVEGLVQELSNAEQSGGLDAALKGFAARYGVATPKLDPKTSTDQQAEVLLKAMVPAAGTYDPLAGKSTQMQQSGGLAASIAGMFFGNAVGLAAGGTMLLQSIKGAVSPDTEFHSAFAQATDHDGLAMCMKAPPQKARTRAAYLWAYRVPNLKAPAVRLAGPTYVPGGLASTIAMKADSEGGVKLLEKVREWRLVTAAGGASEKVVVHAGSAPNSMELDLTKVKLPAGEYKLAANWDWDPLEIAGKVHVVELADFKGVKLAPKAGDVLIEGSGHVMLKLTGADFQFLEKAVVAKQAPHAGAAVETKFTLPIGKRGGTQETVEVDIDTAARGPYRLVLTQAGGSHREIAFTVLPPNPVITGLPLRVNLEEAKQALRLEGKNLDGIEAISSAAGEIKGGLASGSWAGSIRLAGGVRVGQVFPVSIKVKGMETPLVLEGAIKVYSARPTISEVRKSLPAALGISFRADELPSGTAVGFTIAYSRSRDTAEGTAETRPVVELGCKTGGLKKAFRLSPDDHTAGIEFSVAAPGMLFLSLDPSLAGYPGCLLTATVDIDPEGKSDAYPIGRIVRVPRIEQFTLTNEQAGPSTFVGILKGKDLDVIAQTGWNEQSGIRVENVPTPVPGDAATQTLRVALPWPAPSPHSPLYVWLRGENEGRRTGVSY